MDIVSSKCFSLTAHLNGRLQLLLSTTEIWLSEVMYAMND
jgi:hypothetical protein